MFHIIVGMGDNGRPGQVHEELCGIGWWSTGVAKSLVDGLLQLRGHTKAACTLLELDPSQSSIKLMAAELEITFGRGIVVGKKCVEGSFDCLEISIAHDTEVNDQHT